MHELSIAHSILSIAEDAFAPGTKGYITSVETQIGELSAIETESLLFAFDTIKSHSLLANATLNISMIPGQGECRDCHTSFHLPALGTACPLCGSFSIAIKGGREMKVTSIIVEE